ncbi:MAG: T9SS type A sorting domain-containing protein [candidate division WOR-3 bacterium]
MLEIILIAKIGTECANINDYNKRQECIARSENKVNINEPVQFNPNSQTLYKKPSFSILGAPLNESFTGTQFPPVGWSVYNVDNGTQTWTRYTTDCRTTPACASVRWESSTLTNNDWLITPGLVIQSATLNNPTLTFSYRTSTTTNMNAEDSLILYLSTDNGNTWIKIWQWDGVGTTTATNVSIPLNSYISNYPVTILLRFAFFDNKATADASTNYFNLDSLKITDGQYTFLIESWTATTAIYSASYDSTNATTGRRWQRRTSACPFTESTTACVGYAYTETGTQTGYAYLTSPKIYISPSIIGFYYQSGLTSYTDSFDVYIIKWNNQLNPPTPTDFLNNGIRIDTRYPRTGTTGLPYIYTAYDLMTPVSANVNDTVYVAIRYKALNQYRLYIDDVISLGANTIDLPPSISLLKGPTYKFYNGIPDTIRIIASDPQNLPVSCYVGYRYVINSNQEGNSPSGPFTEYQMTLTDNNPNVYPDTFVYIINQVDRGLRGNYYVKCTNSANLTSYIPQGAPNNNWYIYNILPSGKFAIKYEFTDEQRIFASFIRNNIDLQPDLLLYPDSLTWIDSLSLWDRIYWHQNNISATKRTKIINYLNSGTCQNRKSFVLFGNDIGYQHDRDGSANRDTIFTRNYFHFVYISDDWTSAQDVSDTILGITNRPIFGDMTYQIYTNDLWPDDIRNYPRNTDENTSIPILYVKNGDSTIANPNNPSIASVFYNGLGYYTILGSFAINNVATYDANGQSRVDTLFRRIHNFTPISTCLNTVQAYNASYNLAVDGNSPDILKAIVRVKDPSITNENDLRLYGYYRPYGQGSFTKVSAIFDSSNANGYFFHINIPVNEPSQYTKDSFEVYFTAHKLNYGVYGPANVSNTSKIIYEYDVLNAPTNLTVTYRDLDSAKLSWNPPQLLKNNKNQILAFQSYVLEYSENNNNWSVIATINDINTTTYTHTFPVQADSEYIKYYRIKAVYSAGQSPYSNTYTIYDIRAPRKTYADTANFSISGNNLTTDVKAVFTDFSPLKYDTIYYRTLLNPWASKTRDNQNVDTLIYNISISGLQATDTLYFYFVVADTFNNIRITDTTKIPIIATTIADIPKKFDITYKNGLITFALPKQAQIKLEVYNISGRAIIGISSEYNAGYVRFDLNKLPKGVYIIRAKVDKINKQFKTIIIQ